jgi:hypothetical protein
MHKGRQRNISIDDSVDSGNIKLIAEEARLVRENGELKRQLEDLKQVGEVHNSECSQSCVALRCCVPLCYCADVPMCYCAAVSLGVLTNTSAGQGGDRREATGFSSGGSELQEARWQIERKYSSKK